MDRKQRELIRRVCKESLYHFVELIIMHAIRNDKDHPRLPLQPFHKDVLTFCQDTSIKRKGILMPRYFLKSTTITCSMPLWLWINNPEIKSMIVTETHKKAEDSLNFVKGQLERNELLRYIYPECMVDDSWKRQHRWSSIALDLPSRGITKDPSIQVLGVGNAAQGIHVDHIFLDDIIGQKDMLSAIEAENTWKWFSNVEELLITPDMSKPHGSFLYLIGTHYAPEDLYDRVRKTKRGYKWMVIPAEDEHGEPTWTEKLSKTAIEEMKQDPDRSIVYYTQMQNDPMHSGLTTFRPEWKKFYVLDKNADNEDLVVWTDQKGEVHAARIKELDISATIDPATVAASMKEACRTAVVVVGTHKTGAKFVLEAWAKKIRKPSELYNTVFRFHNKYRPRRWGIETFAQQNWVKKTIMEKAREESIAIYLRDMPKDTGKDAKNRRIESLQEDFATGQIYFHESHRDIIGEYHSHPMGLNDLMDALAYHKHWWRNVDQEELRATQRRQDSKWRFENRGLTGYGGGYA